MGFIAAISLHVSGRSAAKRAHCSSSFAADARLPESLHHRVLRAGLPGEGVPQPAREGPVERGGVARDEDDGGLGEREERLGGGDAERRAEREEQGERLHGTSSALRTRA